jgi:hypothetical protein
LTFYRVQGILYTRIGIDELDKLPEQALNLLNDYFSVIDKESNKSGEINKIIHICLSMIFIAHATITDSSKDFMKHFKEEGREESELS